MKRKKTERSLVSIDKRGRERRHAIDVRGRPLCRRKYKYSVRELRQEPVDCWGCMNRLKWRTWDWTQNDAALSREKGLTKERIRRIRSVVGAPRSPNFRLREGSVMIKAAQLPNRIWKTESNSQIAKRLGCYLTYVTAVRQKLGKPAGKKGPKAY